MENIYHVNTIYILNMSTAYMKNMLGIGLFKNVELLVGVWKRRWYLVLYTFSRCVYTPSLTFLLVKKYIPVLTCYNR